MVIELFFSIKSLIQQIDGLQLACTDASAYVYELADLEFTSDEDDEGE